MTDNQKKLRQEKDELNTLIGKGIEFAVDDVEFTVDKKLFGLVRKRNPMNIRRTFRIEEPTLWHTRQAVCRMDRGGYRR